MNSVYVPVHVVVLFRRLVNVVSTLSISKHYISSPAHTILDDNNIANTSNINANRENGLVSAKWLWWTRKSNWGLAMLSRDKSRPLEDIRSQQPSHEHKSPTFSWVNRESSIYSFFSFLTYTSPRPLSFGNDGGNSHRSNSHQKSSNSNHKLPCEQKGLDESSMDIIHQLLVNPALYDPLRTPRYPIVLCHGLYGFDTRGPSTFPSMRMHYWANVLNVLRDKIKAEVIVTSVPGTGSIVSRAEKLNSQLHSRVQGRGVNFLAHSMGGLDCRHLITHIRPSEYAPLSLTTIGTPHRGSPFMDWCADNIGIGKIRQQEQNIVRDLSNNAQAASATVDIARSSLNAGGSKNESVFLSSLSSLPSSFTTLLLSIVDSPAYANLTTTYLNNVFNPSTPNDPKVKYFSVAGRMPNVNIWHPFWLPKTVLDGVEEKERSKLKLMWEKKQQLSGLSHDHEPPFWAQEREWGNDGLVTVQSAKWGEFLGIMEGCDHWEMRGARGIEFGVDLPAIPAFGLGSPSSETANGDGWGMNWGRFVGAWKKKESHQRDLEAVAKAREAHLPPKSPREREVDREIKRKIERESDDEFFKSSTDRLSLVFDWLIEQIPASQALGIKGKVLADAAVTTNPKTMAAITPGKVGKIKEMKRDVSEMKRRMDKEGLRRKKKELESKHDLEQFYVALSRKMYDEGL